MLTRKADIDLFADTTAQYQTYISFFLMPARNGIFDLG